MDKVCKILNLVQLQRLTFKPIFGNKFHPHPRQPLQLTIHLSFVGENDFPSSTRRIDRQSLLEALFNVGTPDAFSIVGQVVTISRHVTVIVSAANSAALASTCVASIAYVVHHETRL